MGNITPVTITKNNLGASQLTQEQQNTEAAAMRNMNDEEPTVSDNQDGTGEIICAFQPKIKSSESNSPSNTEEKQSNTCSSLKPKIKPLKSKEMTLQQYRKAIGLKIQNEKKCKKLGMSPTTETGQEKGSEAEPNFTIPCPHCGAPNQPANAKCDRCSRVFEKIRLESHRPNGESTSEKSSYLKAHQTKDFYGNRRPRIQHKQPSRQTRQKPEEPQCVVLSSDEEEAVPDMKKFKEGSGATEEIANLICESVQSTMEESMDVDIETEKPRSNQESTSPTEKWNKGGWPEPYFFVNCRSVRVGSYRFVPTERVLLCSKGIRFEAPVWEQSGPTADSKTVTIEIETFQLLNMEVHFSHTLPVIFIYVTPSLSRLICGKLGLSRDIPESPFFSTLSTEEYEKRLTLWPTSLDETAKYAIRQAFVPKGVFKEITRAKVDEILVSSSPPEVVKIMKQMQPKPATNTPESPKSPVIGKSPAPTPNKDTDETKRITRSKRKSILPLGRVENMFQWSEGKDKFSISTDEYLCLNGDNLLNDSIIDFYLRYIFSTQLDEELRKRCYVFSSFFYKRLTTRSANLPGRKHPIEDDPKLTIAEKRHMRVKSWTKNVDLFEKDYLIIPINENAHWFLAIVCFPGLPEPITMSDSKPVFLPQPAPSAAKTPNKTRRKILTVGGESFCIGNTTITPVGSAKKETPISVTVKDDSERDEADSEDEFETTTQIRTADEIPQGVKQSCILFFDSMSGASHRRVAATLRQYLMIEYRVKKCGNAAARDSADGSGKMQDVNVAALFSKENMVYGLLDVPQQANSYDCGVFVLHYAELFMKKPFVDYYLPRIALRKWFPANIIKEKRKKIQRLLVQLTKELNPAASTVLKLLGATEEESNISDQIDCDDTFVTGEAEEKPRKKVERDFSRAEKTDVADITKDWSDHEPLADSENDALEQEPPKK